jgi:hypothetical protein
LGPCPPHVDSGRQSPPLMAYDDVGQNMPSHATQNESQMPPCASYLVLEGDRWQQDGEEKIQWREQTSGRSASVIALCDIPVKATNQLLENDVRQLSFQNAASSVSARGS